MKISDEQIERANYVNLPQFLMMHGFDLKRVGKEYVWKEHDSLHIRDNAPGERGRWYRFSESKGGDNIRFLREYMGLSFAQAVEALTGEHIDLTYTAPTRTYQPKPVQQTARELSLAEADNARRVFAYLCKTRGLDYDLISSLVRQGVISQEHKTGNVLFKYYDYQGKIIGAEKVGTSTEHKFKGIATGSVGGHGFEIVRGSGENAFFFESAIDMLSYLQMHDKELTDCRLVSMMGVKPNIVLDTMRRHNISPENVFLCSDNDTAGNEFADRLREEYPDMKRIITSDTYKDWNDMLRGIPKITEQKKEADMQLYGNKMWNDATDNRDKSLISMQSSDFRRVQDALENSGINYYAYELNGTIRMAVNDKDTDWLRNILGDVNITKSNRPYSPPEKNIIGNAEYRYIPQKEYLSADRDLVLKMSEIMAQRGIQFSGRIYPTGKGTLTVSHDDIFAVREIQKSVIEMRKQFGTAEKGQEIGNQEYRQNRDTHFYMSKLTPEQFSEIKPFLETSVNYHAVAKDGKVAFAVDKENAPAFHRALQNAEREVGMLRNMSDLDLPMEKNAALSPVIHRLAVEDMQFNLADFFDKRYDNAQFGEMLSLVNAYLSQAPAERYGENSKLNEMLEAKSSFDRAIELSDFFSQHDFSDEQRAAITAMFVGDVTRGQIDSIDETFTVEDIQAYDEILHNALQESDVADFLTAHKQAVIDRENASRVPTEEEVLFPKADLAKFIAERSLSSDEWEDMAYPLFENGYLDKHKPSDKAILGYHLSEPVFYDLAHRYHDGEDIRRELALGLLKHGRTDDIEFVFEDGKISDRTYYYAENLRHSLHLERTEDGYKCSFGGMERFVSFEEIGQAFIDCTHEEFEDLMYWRVLDYIRDDIPDISDEIVKQLITAFDSAAMADWEKGDNLPKINRIKKVLYDILGDEAQTEKAFACIAKQKYNVVFESEKPESSIHFGLLGNGITAYDVSRTDKETNDYPTVAHISPEGVISLYDKSLSDRDMELIREQARSAREKFINDWNMLSPEQQFQRLYDRADISTMINIGKEKLPMEEKIEKYMPFVFFGEGERPEPQMEEQVKGTYKIYQLPNGEKYHGIRFESKEQLEKDEVQLNHEDYELVYEGEIADFKGNATLEAIFTQFNTAHPADFSGHSLSVSDVIVISADGKESAYYCDGFGFVEMPEFFKEKELLQEKSAVQEITFLGNRNGFDAVKSAANYKSFGTTVSDGDTLTVVINADADVKNVRRLVETAQDNGVYLNIPSAKMLESRFGADFMQESHKPSVADLEVGDVIMYDGARREVKSISDISISLKDLDAPDFGGVLLGTSDVLAYDGWQEDMESKGFEILSKAEKTEPVVDAPEAKKVHQVITNAGFDGGIDDKMEYATVDEAIKAGREYLSDGYLGFSVFNKETKAIEHTEGDFPFSEAYNAEILKLNEIDEPEYKGYVTMVKVGDFFEMYGKNAEIGAEVLGLHMLPKNGSPMIGFPDQVKDEYSKRLSEAGYSVLIEQAFELNPPKREAERLTTLQQVVNKFFGTDCESAEAEGGTWKLAIADGDKVGELFYGGEPVCGIYNRGDKMEIEPYRELSAFPKLLQAAMLEHNSDKIVEIMGFQRTFETALDKAKALINDFCESEYGSPADFSDLHNVHLAYTTYTDDELPIQVMADLVDYKITYEFDSEVFNTEQYDSIEDMIENGLTGLDFSDLVSVPDSIIKKHTAKDEQTIISPEIEASSDIDKPLFTDSAVIEEIQRNERADTPFWEMPDVQGEQLSLFGDPEPIQQKKPEKPKSEFAKGPVVDGVQVYEALAAEIDRGTGFVGGKLRVQDFYEQQHPTLQQIADFLKKEYGTGGHSGDGKISFVDYDSKGLTFSFRNGEKYRHSWYNVAVMTEARLKDNTYLSAEQKVERDALKKEQSAEETDKKVVFEMLGGGKLEFKDDKMETLAEIELSNGKITYFSDNLSETDKAYIAEKSEQFRTEEKTLEKKEQPASENSVVTPTIKNLAQLKRTIKPGMQFEITDHTRSERIGERRVVTGVTTVDFTSRKLNENGEPTGKDIHMEFDRAKNWNFDNGELSSRLDNGEVLMSFHFIESSDRTATKSVPEAEHIEDAPTPDKSDNFTITDDTLGEGGAKAKFRANVEAIRTLKKFEYANLKLAADMFLPRPARAEEKEIMSKYVGWGALAQAFDQNNEKWSAEYQELAELLTPEEYRQARASVNDAFYTSPTIIDSIYEALGNFGFDGGNVLEPAMGVGNFFGRMPEDMQRNSQLYGVEIDSISGRIAQALYPDADIAVKGFEQNTFQNGCFDVAVGNVPFGDLGFVDSVHGTSKLHDYFFAESLDKLKNGGIMAFVTSAGTLDKRDETTRQMLADKADLIGAIRLPGGKNGAFKDNAGTEVTTDIIFLQKHEGKSAAEMSDTPDWVHIGETTDGLPINKYFEQHPEMVLGKVVEGNKLYGSGTMVVAEDGFDLKSALHDAVSKLSAAISPEKGRDVYAKTAQGEQVQIPSNLRNYSFFMSDDQVYFKKNNAACEFRFDKGTAQHKRFKAFIELRDLTRELLEAQELDKPDSVIKDLQIKLNMAYDDFYKKYGLIHSQTNKRYFSEDVSYNLVAGLEKKYDKTKLVEKSDIFTKRTIVPSKAVDHVETALEALTLSSSEKAGVDFAYMSSLTGMTEGELKHDLQGEIFKVPHTENDYQTASEYLSGDIRKKLREAEEIAEYDADFNINVSALKAAMPEPLKAGDIDVKIGAAWLDPKYYEQFIYELLQTPEYQRSSSPTAKWNKSAVIGVEYSEHTNSFHVSNKSSDRSVLATQKFGSHNMNAYDIFEHILNLQDPKIYKTIEVPDPDHWGETKEKRVVDIDATRVVQRKADNIRKAFKNWIFKDPVRREAIVQRYNELFNSIRPREYDGSALSFPMMTKEITLHPHQKNAIAHAMFGGNTLFAHSVGAGKTFEMIATAMESKRLGLCTKSLFAVPNHLTEQIGDDFQKLYPSANILVATKKDFKKENRQQLFAKIATGNFDAVIIGHSQLGMIPVSKERQVMTIQSQIDDILQGIAELKRSEGSKFQIKAMERTRKSLQKQLDKLEKANQDDTLTFEQLGVDRLFLDEMHEFKNLFVSTKLQNVAGISNSASQKALDLFLKVRYLDEKTGNRGFIGATGTPLSNSITELHTMMRYLEYDFLRDHGLQHFDNWVSVFGEQKTDWELAPAGNKFKERTRIANYTGLPELMSMFKQVADIRTADTLQLDVPDCEYKVVQVEATPFQQELVQELSDRADAINSGNVDPTIDNMLKITSDGRKLGLDPRLIDPSFEDDPSTKLNQCVENVARIHAETAEDKLTQIIFCDLGVPHKSSAETEVEGEDTDDAKDKKSMAEQESLEEECDFCVYDDIRDKLIAKGVPAEEIAYIHDAKTEKQKSELFDKVRSGEVRVLLGSTAKMGTGTNVQKKLIAVHDLDIPWRPADLEQRAGRIIRQGNENKNVQIYRYVTKGTFDAYSYQTLENKQRFISQIMTSKTPARKCEDVDQQALTYSEIKALCTGDERIKEKLMLENEVKELRVLSAEHNNTVYEMQDKVKAFPTEEKVLTTILNEMYTDREALRKLPIDTETKLPVFKITINGTEYTDKKEAAKAFETAALAIKYADTPFKIGSFQGFDLLVTMHSSVIGRGMTACLKGAASHTTKLIESFAHNLNRLESALYNIDGRIERVRENLAKLRIDYAEAQKLAAEPFPQLAELESKEERLKTLTDELNQAAIEAKKNAPKREKTCYFERAKMKRDAMRIAKKPKQNKDKGKDKKQPDLE